MAIQEILLDFLEEKKDIKGFINIIDMSADKEKSKTNQKKIVWIFWAFMAIAIFTIILPPCDFSSTYPGDIRHG